MPDFRARRHGRRVRKKETHQDRRTCLGGAVKFALGVRLQEEHVAGWRCDVREMLESSSDIGQNRLGGKALVLLAFSHRHFLGRPLSGLGHRRHRVLGAPAPTMRAALMSCEHDLGSRASGKLARCLGDGGNRPGRPRNSMKPARSHAVDGRVGPPLSTIDRLGLQDAAMTARRSVTSVQTWTPSAFRSSLTSTGVAWPSTSWFNVPPMAILSLRPRDATSSRSCLA
jgi:hypothetical protein